MKLLGSDIPQKTQRVIETSDCFYINGVEYNKVDMTPTVFKTFCDGISDEKYIIVNDTLGCRLEPNYWTGIRRNAVLKDNRNPNVTYVPTFSYEHSTYGNNYATIDVLIKNKKIFFQYWQDANGNTSVFGHQFVTWLGQSDTHLYFTTVGTDYGSGYPPTNTSYPMNGYVNVIPKNKSNIRNKATRIYTSPKSNGLFKVIKETNDNIYFICEKNGGMYDFCAINKEQNSVTILQSFQATSDNAYTNSGSSGVICSDPIKKNDNTYEVYIGGQKQTQNDSGEPIYPNVISKAIIDMTNDSVEIKEINWDKEHIFEHKLGERANEIFILESNQQRFLIAKTSVAYSSSTSKVPFQALSVYELDESSEDNLRATQTQTIMNQDFISNFNGILQNKLYNSFITYNSLNSYILKFNTLNKKFDIYNLEKTPLSLGIDLDGNFWVSNVQGEVFYLTDFTAENIDIKLPDNLEYVGEEIESNIQIACFNYTDKEFVKTKVRIVMTGDAVFSSINDKIIVVETKADGYLDIPIKIQGSGAIYLTPYVIFKE